MSVNVEAGQTRGAGRKLLSFLPTRLRKSRLAHFLRRPPLLFHLVVFALIVLEEREDAAIDVPAALTLIEERAFGDSKLLFLRA